MRLDAAAGRVEGSGVRVSLQQQQQPQDIWTFSLMGNNLEITYVARFRLCVRRSMLAFSLESSPQGCKHVHRTILIQAIQEMRLQNMLTRLAGHLAGLGST